LKYPTTAAACKSSSSLENCSTEVSSTAAPSRTFCTQDTTPAAVGSSAGNSACTAPFSNQKVVGKVETANSRASSFSTSPSTLATRMGVLRSFSNNEASAKAGRNSCREEKGLLINCKKKNFSTAY
jgi:hypothetical protein